MTRKEGYGEEDRRNLRLVVGLSRTINSEQRTTSALLSRHNITLPQFGVLEALYHLGELKIGEIIEKTLSTGGNMTVVIRNLEKEGLVAKRCDPEDRRSSLIRILPPGEELIGEIFPEHLKNLRERFEALSGDEKDRLSGLLKKLNGI
jgi:DNA-binding MarR family transcriptional regulator